MRNGWRVAGLGAALTAVALTTACGSSSDSSASGSPSSAAVSAAATSAPGTYGTPVDPSLPNPTGVASDTPVPSATAGTAAVVITYSGWVDSPAGVEVGAYVAGLAESGGTCTLTLTSTSGSATTQVPGEPDAATTSCPNLTVPAAELSTGTWSAVVRYHSPSTSGESDPVAVVVP